MTQALWLAIAVALWLMGLASLGFGIAGLVRGSPWAYAIAVLCGLVFSIAAGFSIGFYTLLWPMFILGQFLTKGRRRLIRLITGAISCVGWVVLLAAVGVAL